VNQELQVIIVLVQHKGDEILSQSVSRPHFSGETRVTNAIRYTTLANEHFIKVVAL
jgi:hypothetical protein